MHNHSTFLCTITYLFNNNNLSRLNHLLIMKIQSHLTFLVIALLLSLWLPMSGCSTVHQANEASLPPPSASGISGMAQIDGNSWLVVHDALSFENGPRLSIIMLPADAPPVFHPVTVDFWPDPDGRASDLEALCAVPSRPNEYLMAESGTWKGKFGRLFHLRLDTGTNKAAILGVMKLPVLADNNPQQVGDQYEGIACIEGADGRLLLLLGERGGSQRFPDGVIRWGTIDLERHELQFTGKGLEGVNVNAPGKWKNNLTNRDISDMHISPEGVIWLSAADDNGDNGTFASIIYSPGKITGNFNAPVMLNRHPKVWRTVSSIKVEGLSGPAASVAGSRMSIGSDDENYGAIWRPVE